MIAAMKTRRAMDSAIPCLVSAAIIALPPLEREQARGFQHDDQDDQTEDDGAGEECRW